MKFPFLPLVLAATTLAALASSQEVGPPARATAVRAVAVTFDDLPMTGAGAAGCPETLIRRVTEELVAQIRRHAIPATGLVTSGGACGDRELLVSTLEVWLDAGLELGNHTHSHPDLNRTALDAYLADILLGSEAIDSLLVARGQEVCWFRPPLLHSGDTPAKKEGLARFLEARGYRLAPVTVDNQEWVFARAYLEAKRARDDAAVARIVEGYLDHLEESFRYYEEVSRLVVGREIPQVLLLHANLLNADHLDRVVEMVRARGYRFVSLAEALDDPAYTRPDAYIGPRGLSWLQRWALAEGVEIPPEPREPDWLGV